MFRKSLYLLFFISQLAFAQDYYQLASSNFYSGKYDQALKDIDQAIESANNPEDYLLRATIHQALGNNTNAHDDYVKAITIDKNYYEAYFQFSEFLYETMEFERAIASLNFLLSHIGRGETKGIFIKNDIYGQEGTQLTSLVGMEAEILIKRGLALQKIQRLDEALVDFDRAIELDESVDKLVNRALLLLALGEKNKAKENLNNAIELNPMSSLAWYNFLIVDPTISLPETLEKDPDFAPMISVKGIEAFEAGDFKSAGRLFSQALRLTPNDPVLLLNAGRVDQRNQNFKLAQDKFIKVLKLEPSKSEALYLLGNSFFGQKEFTKALHQYERYLKTDPTHAQTWFNSAMAYMELEEEENACTCLNRSADLGMARARTFISEYCSTE